MVDARLPNPPILTCNKLLPLRILVKRESGAPLPIIVQMLQVDLIAYTHIRASDLTRTRTGMWSLLGLNNTSMLLGRENDPVGTEWEVPVTFPLPNTVSPSFETCNISRSYELDVRIGFTHGGVGINVGETDYSLKSSIQSR